MVSGPKGHAPVRTRNNQRSHRRNESESNWAKQSWALAQGDGSEIVKAHDISMGRKEIVTIPHRLQNQDKMLREQMWVTSTEETSSFKGIHPGPKLISQDLADLDLQADNLLKVRSLGDWKRGLTLRLLCLVQGPLSPSPALSQHHILLFTLAVYNDLFNWVSIQCFISLYARYAQLKTNF